MSLRGAAHLLSETQVSGAPVVDEAGRCVGVLSATDFMHWVGYGERGASGPGCFHSTWQATSMNLADEVEAYMTADPVTVPPSTTIAELACAMINAHIHRIIVVDAQHRPIGIVSSTDILATVVREGQSSETCHKRGSLATVCNGGKV
jgi:CBS domain-containing protein